MMDNFRRAILPVDFHALLSLLPLRCVLYFSPSHSYPLLRSVSNAYTL